MRKRAVRSTSGEAPPEIWVAAGTGRVIGASWPWRPAATIAAAMGNTPMMKFRLPRAESRGRSVRMARAPCVSISAEESTPQRLSRRYRSTARLAASAREMPGVRVISKSMSRSSWASLPKQMRRSCGSALRAAPPPRRSQSHTPSTTRTRIAIPVALSISHRSPRERCASAFDTSIWV